MKAKRKPTRSNGLRKVIMKVKCKFCQGILDVAAELHGKQIKCGNCQNGFIAVDPKRAALEKKVQRKKEKKAIDVKAKREEVAKQALLESRKLQELNDRNAVEKFRTEQQGRRQNELSQECFDVTNHDWSVGGPFVYQCVEMHTLSGDWQFHLSKEINKMAEEGWEYYRAESLVAQRLNGCLWALFGNATTEFSVAVLVFRKPTRLKIFEQSS